MSVVNNYNLIEYQEGLIQPIFGGFQLIGDSLFVRFADQILQSHRNIPGTNAIGHCVSGQRIDQLRHRIKLKLYPLSSKVMVLIGTNDVLYGGNICTMIKHFSALLNILQKSVENILILTLPPIPRFCVTYFHWTLIRQYNSYLKSLSDRRNVTVADICPLFTKFKGAMEYEIPIIPVKISDVETKNVPALRSSNYFAEEGQNEQVKHVRKRKSLLGRRRKCFLKQRNFGSEAKSRINLERSESDYRNTTDTNTSADSEILSSELSQERENFQNTIRLQDATNIQEKPITSPPKTPKKAQSPPTAFVKRTLESVFGKDAFRRKKTEVEEKKSKIQIVGQPEKRLRKSPMDLNDNLRPTDSWQVESDEDSMKEHVYKSQEEIEYDVLEVGSQKKKKRSDEFSKFCESFNENDKTPKKNICHRKLMRENLRNERSENAESSSSSDVEISKKQLRPYIDPAFRYFFEKSVGESDCSMDSDKSFCYSPEWGTKWFNYSNSSSSPVGITRKGKLTPNLCSPTCERRSFYENFFQFSRGFKQMNGISGKDKLIFHLANKICRLQCYELFYSFRKKRIDMIHLNYHGLTELKNFLIANNFVSI